VAEEEREQGQVRNELIEQLKALETPQSATTLAELAYRRAREALEKALEEARHIRIEALEDARATRERELTAVMEALKALRASAETQIASIIAQAETEANQVRARAREEAETMLTKARSEADSIRSEAVAIRAAAEERAHETGRLEASFNQMAAEFAGRVGLGEQPAEGWLKRLFGRRQ